MYTKLHSITSQKTVIFIVSTVMIQNLSKFKSFTTKKFLVLSGHTY